jgi:hypothetical protein
MSRRFPDPWRTLPAAPFVSRFVMVILDGSVLIRLTHTDARDPLPLVSAQNARD